jgi:hypothetical protein
MVSLEQPASTAISAIGAISARHSSLNFISAPPLLHPRKEALNSNQVVWIETWTAIAGNRRTKIGEAGSRLISKG